MAVAADLGDPNSPLTDVHPRYKRPVGERLSNGALAIAYGRTDVYWSGPIFESAWLVAGGKIVVNFHDCGVAGIKVKHSVGFEIRSGVNSSQQRWTQLPIAGWNKTSLWLDASVSLLVTGLRYNWYEGACLPLEGPYHCAVYADVEQLPAPPFITTNLLKPVPANPVTCRWNITQPAYYFSSHLPGGSSQYLSGQGAGFIEGDFDSTAYVNVPNGTLELRMNQSGLPALG